MSSITIHAGKSNRIRECTAVPMVVQALSADASCSPEVLKVSISYHCMFHSSMVVMKTVANWLTLWFSQGSRDQRKLEGNQEPKILPRFFNKMERERPFGSFTWGALPGWEVQQFLASLSSYQEDGSGWLRDPVAPGAFHTSSLHLAVISPMKSSFISNLH